MYIVHVCTRYTYVYSTHKYTEHTYYSQSQQIVILQTRHPYLLARWNILTLGHIPPPDMMLFPGA